MTNTHFCISVTDNESLDEAYVETNPDEIEGLQPPQPLAHWASH